MSEISRLSVVAELGNMAYFRLACVVVVLALGNSNTLFAGGDVEV